MQQWWKHHESTLPIFEGRDKHLIEDITGRIPLLLQPLLGFSGSALGIVQDFLKHKDIVGVTKNVQEFARDVKDKHGPTNFTT
jgi:hypothetical protein